MYSQLNQHVRQPAASGPVANMDRAPTLRLLQGVFLEHKLSKAIFQEALFLSALDTVYVRKKHHPTSAAQPLPDSNSAYMPTYASIEDARIFLSHMPPPPTYSQWLASLPLAQAPAGLPPPPSSSSLPPTPGAVQLPNGESYAPTSAGMPAYSRIYPRVPHTAQAPTGVFPKRTTKLGYTRTTLFPAGGRVSTALKNATENGSSEPTPCHSTVAGSGVGTVGWGARFGRALAMALAQPWAGGGQGAAH